MQVRRHRDEVDRLASLASYGVLDSEPVEDFDALTRLAAGICETPMSLIALVDEDRQWFLSRFGVDVIETPRTESVSSDAVASGRTLVVDDLSTVARYAHLATVSAGSRAYAAVPLIGRDGLPLGALCVVDTRARTFSAAQVAALADLARQAVIVLELRRSDSTRGLNSGALVPEAAHPQTMRRSLDNHEFIPYFQPVVDMRDGTIRGLEALIRWQHPTRGLLTPEAFLPALEIGTLSDWTMRAMLEAVCTVVLDLRSRGLDPPDGVAVNVSGSQLKCPGLAADVLATLERFDVPAGAVWLEITETTEISDVPMAGQELLALRDAGVRVVADDFGVGWSNLVRLLRFPMSGLKIDKELVTRMIGDPVRIHMVAATIALAGTIGLDVIAEGVETREVRDLLLAMGCQQGQGWLFSKAVPADDLPDLFARARVGPGLLPAASADLDRTGAAASPHPGQNTVGSVGPACANAAHDDEHTPDAAQILQVQLDNVRTLLRVDSAEQAVGALIRAVSDLGGETVPATHADAGAIPIDISLGEADPLLPRADPGSHPRGTLERLLPAMVEDAKVAATRAARLARLSEQVDTDPLTGLANRRGLSRIRSLRRADSIAMIDLDHFKDVNDTYGHADGDRVLVAFSRALRQHLRATDLVFRLGGEEFLVVMPGTPAAGVLDALNHLRQKWQVERPLRVTFSAGVAAVGNGDLSAAVLAADAALYQAKTGGRDRFEVDPIHPPIAAVHPPAEALTSALGLIRSDLP